MHWEKNALGEKVKRAKRRIDRPRQHQGQCQEKNAKAEKKQKRRPCVRSEEHYLKEKGSSQSQIATQTHPNQKKKERNAKAKKKKKTEPQKKKNPKEKKGGKKTSKEKKKNPRKAGPKATKVKKKTRKGKKGGGDYWYPLSESSKKTSGRDNREGKSLEKKKKLWRILPRMRTGGQEQNGKEPVKNGGGGIISEKGEGSK